MLYLVPGTGGPFRSVNFNYVRPLPVGCFFVITRDHGDTGFVERRYGGVPARDAALVIQRAYRRYSMVKEFQRIKTERRLSRRINNNVISSTTAPPVNSCEICIDVHPDSSHPPIHHHPHHGVGHLDGLEDDLEESSMLSGDLPTPQDLAEVTEVDVEVDRTHVPGHSIGLPPAQVHSQQHHHTHHHHTQWHLQKSYSHHHTQNNSSRGVLHHQSSSSSGRYPSDSQLSSSRHHYPPHQGHQPQQQRVYIPPGHHHQHSSLHHQQSHPQLQHQNTVPPSLGHNQHSAPGGLLMIKGGSSSHLHPASHQSNGSSPVVSNSPASSNTTPLTNVSPNLSTSSASSGKVLGDVDSEVIRKRLYRVGLNLFNKKPEVGVTYLVKKKFLEGTPPAVARFLISRKGLSKQMIGEYLTNLQNPFSMSCLEHFCNEIDLSSMPVDLALRRFQSFYRMPGEAQKIERLMESFSRRYGVCNPAVVSQFRNGADTVFVLAFAIIMLNTDLHTPHLKQDRRMKLEDFIKNLRGVDDGGDIDREILTGIYDRIKSTEFKTGSDHVTQVMKVQQTIVGKKPNLAVPHRRLVCYCRLYEVPDTNKKEKAGCHQREVFLFNDLLVLTKIFHKKRNSVTYSFRQSYPLAGLTLHLFSNQYYEHGLSLRRGETVLLNLNARNEHDRAKFTEDLREAIAESDEMTRIESLSKENRDRDSGVDVGKIKRFSNSLLDINDQCKPVRRGSCGSLDSGMSVSFQSDETHQNQGQPLQASNTNSFPMHQHQGSTCSSSSSSSQNSHK